MTTGFSFVIADDHPLFRGALRQALLGIDDRSRILEVGDFEGTKALIARSEEIDLVLLDLSMPGVSGLSGLVALRGGLLTMWLAGAVVLIVLRNLV